MEAARQGLGATMLGDWMIAEDMRRGTLVSIMSDWLPSLHEGSSGDIYAMFLNDRYMKSALKSFIACLCSQIG